MKWDDLGSPMERATFRLVTFLISHLVRLEVVDREKVAIDLAGEADLATDPVEKSILMGVVAAYKGNAPPNFELIKGGRDE